MHEPQAFQNGRWIAASQLTIPIYDAGFVLGATVTEQLRTFGGKLFRLDEHLVRLYRSLEIVDIDPGLDRDELKVVAETLVERNFPLIAPAADLGVGMFVTPGPYPVLAAGVERQPLVCAHSYPLPFGQWSEIYTQGESVVVSDIRQVPPECWPAELKCRSRMHYFLADRQARASDPNSRAILLDDAGYVSEATTANLVLYRGDEGLVSPPLEKILPGISLMVLARLARGLGIPMVYRDVHPRELATADELLLTSTSVCLLPVVRCNGKPVGSGKPGPVNGRLLEAWSAEVGLNIVEQSQACASLV